MRSRYLQETSRRLLQDGRGVHRPPRPPRYLSVPRFPSPARVDPGTGDRIPPVGLPSPCSSISCPVPRPLYRVPPGAPRRPCPRRRRQDSPAPRLSGGETPRICTLHRGLSRYLDGSFRDAPRVLPAVPGTVPVAVRRVAVRRARPRRLVRRPSASAPGRTSPVPLEEALASPASRSVLPPARPSRSISWTGPPSSPRRDRRSPRPRTPAGPLGGYLRISNATKPSTPRRRRAPGAFGDRDRHLAPSYSTPRPSPQEP